uniref:Short chain dehydrogenase n=1 Tax=Paulinella chromatophora TaxID=39717 RepID=B1X3G1_PAUCH|nr:short chain dehydrogenase [Paulinella chromatophora]ACB42480.1 short chain dehydrogenase [Paulinella chromatophora]
MRFFNPCRSKGLPLKELRIGVSGASGALGQSLIKYFHKYGARVVGLTSGEKYPLITDHNGELISVKWVSWQCGEEETLVPLLKELDLLILNHGINTYQNASPNSVAISLEINTLSCLRLMNTILRQPGWYREIWINTSEAEIEPAFSPIYEISKRFLGQLVTIQHSNLFSTKGIRIRKLVLGPFRSSLNPIGLMNPEFVARSIILQATSGLGLIVVTPNPLAYILIPLNEFGRWLYYKSFSTTRTDI